MDFANVNLIMMIIRMLKSKGNNIGRSKEKQTMTEARNTPQSYHCVCDETNESNKPSYKQVYEEQEIDSVRVDYLCLLFLFSIHTFRGGCDVVLVKNKQIVRVDKL